MRTEQEIRRALEFCQLTKPTIEATVAARIMYGATRDLLEWILGEKDEIFLTKMMEGKDNFAKYKALIRSKGFE